jgi:PAS domain S-box-containing protein
MKIMKYVHKKKYRKGFKRPSLLRKMTVIIVLSVVLISVASSFIFFAIASKTHQARFNQERDLHISFLTNNLQLPLFNYDFNSVEKTGQIMMGIDMVSAVSIKDDKGNLVFSADKSCERCESIRKTNIIFRGRVVGSFELCLRDEEFIRQQKEWIITGFVNTLMIILGITTAVISCVNRFFKKPLSDFVIRIKTMADGDYHFDTMADASSEFSPIFDSFHQMAVKIQHRQKKLVESNQSLEIEIDKNKVTEQLLRESEEKYRSFNDNIPVGFFRDSVDGEIIEYNPFLLQLLNIPAHDNIRHYNGEDFYQNPEDRKEMIRRILQEKKINGFECRIKKKGGQIAWASISARAIEDRNGNIQYIDGVLEDITEKKAREEQLIQFAKVIEQADEEVVITSEKGIIEYVNPSFEKNTGYTSSEVIGRTPSILKGGSHDRSFYKDLWDTILNKDTWKGILKNKNKNGEKILHDTTITPIIDSKDRLSAFVSIRRDITQQREIEKQLYQSQKMQAIGTLAGGIAHDFNNILSGIFGYSQIAQFNIPNNPEKALDCMGNIVKASQRAAELVQQILTFSRQAEYKRIPLCVYLEVNEALKLIRSSIPVNIKIQNKLKSRSLITADPTRIHQMVMNLCTNAYHAMEKSGGTLTVSLDDANISKPQVAGNKKMPPGRYLVLKISDTGCGMTAKTLEKAFEPYFTTKTIGHGTGLGLPIVQVIVEEHQGFLDVFSSIGEGTQFSLYFPIVERPAKNQGSNLKRKPELNGSETIMLVDDEKAIRDSWKDFLERHGYQVSEFRDGIDAIEAFRVDPYRFDLVITDMAMQEKTGSELIQVIRRLNEAVPVIICSGFSNMMDETIARQIGADKYLMKPLQVNDLIAEVRNLLDKK